MELRLFLPDRPRDAWSALKYWWRARKSPVRRYGIDEYQRMHRVALQNRIELDRSNDKIKAQAARIVDLSRELSALKRASKG